PGITCHYGMLSKAMTSHASLKALYLSLIFYRACWLGGVKVVATAHAATRKSNDEITFIVALTWCTLLFCLDNLPLDPSVLKILWADMLTGDTLRYKLMTPIYKSHAAWLRRNCSKKIRLRPVINVGQRIVDHEVLHLADSDAFYPTIVGLTWCLAALASCLFDSQLAVLKSPYYCIGDLASVNFARRISSGLVNWVAHLLSAARASLQSVRWSNKQINRKFCCCPASCLCCSCCEKSASLASAEQKMQQQQQQQQQLTPLLQQEELATMSIAEQLVREKYTREETELVLSSLAEAGLRQRLIDGSRRTSAFSASCLPLAAPTVEQPLNPDVGGLAWVQLSGTLAPRRWPGRLLLVDADPTPPPDVELLGPAPPPSAIFNRIFSQPRSNVGWRIRTTDGLVEGSVGRAEAAAALAVMAASDETGRDGRPAILFHPQAGLAVTMCSGSPVALTSPGIEPRTDHVTALHCPSGWRQSRSLEQLVVHIPGIPTVGQSPGRFEASLLTLSWQANAQCAGEVAANPVPCFKQ
uniref:Rab-GAP TBC domain-containing protein n=1 Tax=Macrostomum lignano TaxID=282301 RepID=A0A1I8F7N0_9PLAT